MTGCCTCCCHAIRPRYKRLVCNIFPENQQDGLVKENMQKLTFYALSSPEKLDRIGEYMATRLNRDLYRNRMAYVFIALEALDQLLLACHSQSINLFVESFLKIMQKLLEHPEPDLQCAATSSFIKFSNIEEDTPSYHRRYDFFISKFSSMCHNDSENRADRQRLRASGIHGIQGIIRKTISDDLQVNIWDPVHMDKIVPSLLFNMQDPLFVTGSCSDVTKDEEHPCYVAETVFRDLVCRASYGNIKPVIRPVLMHMDNHRLWNPNDFSIKTFKIIMYSVQAQHGYLIIQCLMSHLDNRMRSDPNVKAGIVEVLYETVLIAAGASIGSSVLEVFNTLLRHLRLSVDASVPDMDNPNQERMAAEKRFQYTIINTIGEFANHLPDYQKIEIMMFVMSKLPTVTDETITQQVSVEVQSMLLKTMLKVATKYQTTFMTNAFPDELFGPLLKVSVAESNALRILVQDILHTLLDRHGNATKLQHVTADKDVSELDLIVEKCHRQDISFMKRSGIQFYNHIYENLMMVSNDLDNYKALYCTLILLIIEFGVDEFLSETLRLILQIQKDTEESVTLLYNQKYTIHGLLAAYMNVISQLTMVDGLSQYISEVLALRRSDAKFLLPGTTFSKKVLKVSPVQLKDYWLFNQPKIASCLVSAGHDVSTLSIPYTAKTRFYISPDVAAELNVQSSDVQSVQIELESTESTPVSRRKQSAEEVTYESLKKMLALPDTERKEQENRRRLEIIDMFRTAPFEQIVARVEAKSQNLSAKLNEIFESTKDSFAMSSLDNIDDLLIPEIKYPEQFLYHNSHLPHHFTKV